MERGFARFRDKVCLTTVRKTGLRTLDFQLCEELDSDTICHH